MYVRRDSFDSPSTDFDRTHRLVDLFRRTEESVLRVWSPPAHVNFGRRDASVDGYERAVDRATERGYPTIERSVGGRAVVHTDGTLAVAHITGVAAERADVEGRYERFLSTLTEGLEACDVSVDHGEPPDSFCPGSHSLSTGGRKVAGVAQRVHSDVAVVSAILVVRNHTTVAEVLAPIYTELSIPFDTASVGSLAGVGGPADPEAVGNHIIAAFR
jgi:lipoate-protein ligase A